MVVFSSIIVLDLETTSMPHLDYKTTRIVEIAFVGFEVKHLKSSKKLPRVLHKLVLLFNPNKLISPEATAVSGLDNELLENVKPFQKEDADTLKHFISRLPPPVCIVAHNGEKFDFPILRRALDPLKVVFGSSVYCADSVKAFKEIYPKMIPKSSVKRLFSEVKDDLTHPDKTPPNQKTIPMNKLHYKNEVFDTKRKLFPDHEELENLVCTPSTSNFFFYPKSYKLKDIHLFMLGKNIDNAHRAEIDSLALLECIIQCDEFLNWISNHSVIFDNVPPLF